MHNCRNTISHKALEAPYLNIMVFLRDGVRDYNMHVLTKTYIMMTQGRWFYVLCLRANE